MKTDDSKVVTESTGVVAGREGDFVDAERRVRIAQDKQNCWTADAAIEGGAPLWFGFASDRPKCATRSAATCLTDDAIAFQSNELHCCMPHPSRSTSDPPDHRCTCCRKRRLMNSTMRWFHLFVVVAAAAVVKTVWEAVVDRKHCPHLPVCWTLRKVHCNTVAVEFEQ